MNTIFSLLPRASIGSIYIAELVTRFRWWISHPQAYLKQGNTSSLNFTFTSFSLVDGSVFGGTGWEPKKTPPLRLPLLGADLRLPNPPLLITARGISMIYSFITTLKPSNTFRLLINGGVN